MAQSRIDAHSFKLLPKKALLEVIYLDKDDEPMKTMEAAVIT
jgi:hypothetical protein